MHYSIANQQQLFSNSLDKYMYTNARQLENSFLVQYVNKRY